MNTTYDDHNVFTFDYRFDKEELIKNYHQFANDENVRVQHWPWIIKDVSIKKTWMDVENGWERRYLKQWPTTISDPALKNYPYIKHILHKFDISDRANVGFFWFAKNYQQIVHRDGGDYRVQPHAGTTAELKKNGYYDSFKQHTVPEGHKGLVGFHFVLEGSDAGVYFTTTNTREKSENDPHYIYKSALLNVDNHHYVNTSDKERLLFKIQIYEPDFFTCVQRLKSKLN